MHCTFAAGGQCSNPTHTTYMPHIPCEPPLVATNTSIHSPTSVLKVASDHTLKVWHWGSLHQEWSSAVQAAYQPRLERSAARCQSGNGRRCSHIAANGIRQVQEHLGVPFFTDHIRYEGRCEMNASYFIMLAHDVRGECC
jgi:hypothetical protein